MHASQIFPFFGRQRENNTLKIIVSDKTVHIQALCRNELNPQTLITRDFRHRSTLRLVTCSVARISTVHGRTMLCIERTSITTKIYCPSNRLHMTDLCTYFLINASRYYLQTFTSLYSCRIT